MIRVRVRPAAANDGIAQVEPQWPDMESARKPAEPLNALEK